MQIELDMWLPSGGSRLQDSFQWDVSNPENCPHHFSKVLLQEVSLDSPDNVIAVANEIRHKIETYCASLSLNLKKNIEACFDDASACDGDLSDEGLNGQQAAFADFQTPQIPPRKRDWKTLSKTISTRIDQKLDASELDRQQESLLLAGLVLRHDDLKPVKPTRTSPQKIASQENDDPPGNSASNNNISVEGCLSSTRS